jgi:hypothetical protein
LAVEAAEARASDDAVQVVGNLRRIVSVRDQTVAETVHAGCRHGCDVVDEQTDERASERV